MNYLRLDKVIEHLKKHSTTNTYYKGLLRQYELLGKLSPKQVASVEKAMAIDEQVAYARQRRELREWQQ